jgi:hexokinase
MRSLLKYQKPMRPYKKQTIVINTEAGNFPFEKRGAIERSVDECSENPGSHLLEKSVSGKYLGEIFARAIAEAGKEGLWENDLCGPFASRPPLSLSDMENFLSWAGFQAFFFPRG